MKERGCEIVNKAVKLAPQMGLDKSEVKCPYISICTGKDCTMIKKTRVLPFTLEAEKFYDRIQKALEKLH